MTQKDVDKVTPAIKVLLAEDHNLVRAGIRSLLKDLSWIEIVGEAKDGQQAFEFIQSLQPDVVLTDISMPKLNGLELLAKLKDFPATRIIILSMHANKEYVWQALRAGASGYVLKDAEAEELEFAIKSVYNGQVFLSPQISKYVVEDYLWRANEPTSFEKLTSRQRQILQLIAQGQTTKHIAETLQISIKTAETHRTQLMEQLDIHDIAGLVRYAVKMGLIDVNS